MTMLHPAVLAVVLLALSAAPAWAGPGVDQAATALREDPVYVDPEADPGLSAGQERRLENQISEASAGPIYVAVLPPAARSEAGGDVGGLVELLFRASGERGGTYAVVAGRSLRAGSTLLGRGR